jgi:xylulokinase
LIVVGGASHSDLWMQIIADVTGYPVYTIVQDVEAALGAALLAAHAVGLVDGEQVRKGWVELELRAEPTPENVALYSTVFADYLALYPALKPIMHRLQGTSS